MDDLTLMATMIVAGKCANPNIDPNNQDLASEAILLACDVLIAQREHEHDGKTESEVAEEEEARRKDAAMHGIAQTIADVERAAAHLIAKAKADRDEICELKAENDELRRELDDVLAARGLDNPHEDPNSRRDR